MLRCMAVVGLVLSSSLMWSDGAQAESLRLARIFGDGMVLQRDQEVPIWGWAAPGVKVKVSLGTFEGGRAAETLSADDGKWRVRINTYPAGGPYQITVNAGLEVAGCSDVYMGDVWVCSGQSNMEWPVWVNTGTSARYVDYATWEVANAIYPKIRLYTVPKTTSLMPLEDVPLASEPMYPGDSLERLGSWQVCTPDSVPPFSAVAYFFGRELYVEKGVPIGLIQTAWGGTFSEAWTSAEALNKLTDFHAFVKQLKSEQGDPEVVKKKYEEAWTAWRNVADETDPGYAKGRPPWAKKTLDVAEWQDIHLPAYWEDSGFEDLDGYVWFRKDIDVSTEWADETLELHLTAVDDDNQTWFNGEQVSDFEEQSTTARKYIIPGKLVKAGHNSIVVRVYDQGKEGGFNKVVGKMSLRHPLLGIEQELSLKGDWKMRVGVELKDLPPRPVAPKIPRGKPRVPTVLYNAMIAPIIPFGIKGVIWYQGEANANRAYQYRELFPALINDWRAHWGQGDFPFLFVQLANYLERVQDPAGHPWAELREAQTMALSLANTGMAVAIDVGDAKDIHPKNKQAVGKRLALAARHVAYGEDIVYSGPMYLSMKRAGTGIRIHFKHVEGGLKALGGPPTGFSIAGADQQFEWAHARIVGDSVVVWSEEVAEPVAVRYGWAANPLCNLYNTEGLPASPFRTDDWPGFTLNNR